MKRSSLISLMVVLCALPVLLAAGNAGKPTIVTVQTVFKEIPKEHRFTVEGDRVLWDDTTAEKAAEALTTKFKDKRLGFRRAKLWQYGSVSADGQTIPARARIELQQGGVTFELCATFDLPAEKWKDRLKDGERITADVAFTVDAAECMRNRTSAGVNLVASSGMAG